jgi:DHA1 family bicyclomycin/chloramphenicol resistance-like MFS transporter
MTTFSHARRANGQTLILLLGLLAMLGPFSNDTLLPNFPQVAAYFEVSAARMQQTLTVYFIPFAVMHLLHGTLSDAFGRRRVIVLGMAAYAVSSFVCAIAQSFEVLLLGRVLQGLCAGAGVVVGRAVVRDLYAEEQAQRALALVMIIFGIAPGIAPIIGGWVGHLMGWRAVFMFLSLLSGTLFLIALAWLPETLPHSRRTPLSLKQIGKGFVAAFSSTRFVLLVSAFGLNFAGFFIYIVSAPAFGYRILGLEQTEFVWIFGPAITGMILGANVLYHATHAPGLPWSVLPILVYTLGLGVSMPSITLLVLDLMPDRRGLASSLIGFSQSGFSAVLAGVISHQVYESAVTLALCSLLMAALGFVCWLGYLACAAQHLRGARA